MPTSKNGKLYFTQEQFEEARYRASALEYARSQGYNLVKSGSYYTLKEHDSMVFTENGQWFWNSHGMKGGAIEFITQYEHKSVVEAVLALAGEKIRYESKPHSSKTIEKPNEEKLPFILPERDNNVKNIYAYLCGERKLDSGIISKLISQHKLYQSKDYHNAVFVSFDNSGNPKSAFQRGTCSFADKAFKRDVIGSDKSYPFLIEGNKGSNTVAVFEGCIDAISHASLTKLNGNDYKEIHRISLGGVMYNALERFLIDNPEIENIILCLDNDEAGKKAVLEITDKFTFWNGKRYEIYSNESNGKDFNEDLVNYACYLEQTEKEQNEQTNQQEESEAGCQQG